MYRLLHTGDSTLNTLHHPWRLKLKCLNIDRTRCDIDFILRMYVFDFRPLLLRSAGFWRTGMFRRRALTLNFKLAHGAFPLVANLVRRRWKPSSFIFVGLRILIAFVVVDVNHRIRLLSEISSASTKERTANVLKQVSHVLPKRLTVPLGRCDSVHRPVVSVIKWGNHFLRCKHHHSRFTDVCSHLSVRPPLMKGSMCSGRHGPCLCFTVDQMYAYNL